MDDAELLSRYSRDRSEEAFAELVRRHLSLVYFAALRRLGGDAPAAQDVAQDVFVSLGRQASTLSHRPSLAGWLHKTTRNIAAQSARSERRRRLREQASLIVSEPVEEPPADWDQLRPVIDAVVDRLGERDRELVLLRFFQGGTFGEIGARFGLSPEAARFRVNRALEKMRSGLKKHGIESSTAALALALGSQAGASVPAGVIGAVTGRSLAKMAATGDAVPWLGHCLHLMSTTKTAAGFAIVIGCISGGLLLHERALVQSDQARFAADSAEYHTTLAQLQKARRDLRELNRAKDASLRAAAETSGANPAIAAGGGRRLLPTAPSPGSREAKADRDPWAVNLALSHDPAVRAGLSAWMKSAFATEQAAFYRSAALSPEQIASLENLLLQRNINMGPGHIITLRPDDIPPAAIEDDIHQLLGDAAYHQFVQYEQTMYVRDLALGLAGSLYDSATPLTPQQSDQLAEIFARSSPQYQSGAWIFPNMVNWNAALPQAQAILSPPQLEALKNEMITLPGTPGGLNPALPGSFGNGASPPASVFTDAGASK